MSDLRITREELLTLIELVTRDRPHDLRLEGNARWGQDHEEFCRRFCKRLVVALAAYGFAWARVPKDGDDLYKTLVAAANWTSKLDHLGLTSEDPQVAEAARYRMAEHIEDFLRRTKISVIRRKRAPPKQRPQN